MARTPIQLPFDEAKVTQAAALLLKLRGGQMHYLKLIKLLYIADREALRQWGVPITMDRYVAMDHGPVVSRTFNLIQGCPGQNWNTHISDPMGEHEVRLLGDGPGTALLSTAEERLLRTVFARYGHVNRWALVELTHAFPEWHDPDGSSTPIALEEILRALGEGEDQISAQLDDLNAMATARRLRAEL